MEAIQLKKIIYEFTNELADITHCVIIDFVYEKNDDNKGYTYATINAYGEAKIYNNEEKG